MFRRITVLVLLAVVVLSFAACHNKNVKNPLAQVDSKQPDKVLFDRAMEAMKQRKYDVARLSLQTLINAYPDSEFVARAKLGIGDAWYHEGGSAALAQAENEYKDFITFFPNMPEAAEAQVKVADIHYRAMEKPDRDYTHAKRAEEEYRQMLLQYPDSKLADQARKRLLQVQEVLAEREYRIGRFYFLRQSYNASIARLKSMTDAYPLFSKADDALMMVGQSYEAEIGFVRAATKLPENKRAQLIKQYEDGAAEAYSRIVTRYPAMARYDEARSRLQALDRPVPKPTEEAIAQNKKEEASREEMGRFSILSNLQKTPKASMLAASKIGEPTLVDPKSTDAPTLTRTASEILTGTGTQNKVSAEAVKDGKIPENGEVPRSTDDQEKPAQAPAQVNEANATQHDSASTPSGDKATPATDSESSSKTKKKKGLHKLIPF
jgi:outer membrane protein assembly factor BamD